MKNANNNAGKNKLLLVADEKNHKLINKEVEAKFNEFTDLLIKLDFHKEDALTYLHRLSNLLRNEIGPTDTKQIQKAQFLPSKSSHKSNFQLSLLIKLIKLSISILLITVGFALIIIPAPSDSFEIATLFYFNPQDGVTVMDIIALLIIFFGIYILIYTVMTKRQ